MKKILILSISLFITLSCQSQNNKEDKKLVAMSDTYQKAYKKGSIYYKIGSDIPFTGTLYGKYDNGNYMTMQEYVDGIGNGKWIDFDPMGNKVCEGTYIDNKVEGPVTFFYENGSVKSKGQYLDWKQPIGLWTYFDKEGNVVHTMTYTR
ncbi:hypothetical protein [Olleya sp. YS]|uniref:toxin-antitoxin system YwqK family antitoxin n=1 Tax=Olleya sp. YS TaxID=3028318 RepID=UPI002434672C|nr:hypothetical protein [Olleya sp. YS]WGD34555.1 hypothetical protein Ollyesu_12290 [Olleya sp. YS]